GAARTPRGRERRDGGLEGRALPDAHGVRGIAPARGEDLVAEAPGNDERGSEREGGGAPPGPRPRQAHGGDGEQRRVQPVEVAQVVGPRPTREEEGAGEGTRPSYERPHAPRREPEPDRAGETESEDEAHDSGQHLVLGA